MSVVYIMKGVQSMDYSFGTDEYIYDVLNRYSGTLIKLAFTYVKNVQDSEDIVQNVFIKLMTRSSGFKDREHEKAWLIRVTINMCKNHLKSSWIKRVVPLEDTLSYMPKEESTVLIEVMELPDNYKNAVYMYYYEGYSIKEISEILKTKSATVGTWLSRAREMLKVKLGGLEDETAI